MRHFTRILMAITLLPMACQNSTIAPVEPPDSGALALAEPPAASGVVVRFEGLAGFPFFVTIDSERGLTAIQGIDIVQACQGNPTFESVGIQQIQNPSGAVGELLKGDDLTTSVWPFAGFNCFLFTTTDPLATGTSSILRHDNDIAVSGSRTNAFGWRGSGDLYNGVGETVRFHNIVQVLILQNGSLKDVVSNIFLN